jgi:hypothetical protein
MDLCLDEMDAVRLITKDVAEKLRQATQQAVKNDAEGSMKLAQCVYELSVSAVESGTGSCPWPVWELWGYKSWREFADKELHMAARKQERLRLVWWVFGIQLAGKWDESLLLPFSKMRSLCRVVNEQNVNDWLKRAAGMGVSELEHRCHGRVDDDVGDGDMYAFHAYLVADEMDRVEKAFRLGRRCFDATRKGSLLTKMLSEWANAQEATLGGDLPATVAKVEAVFGVKLVVLGKDSALLYGIDALEALVKKSKDESSSPTDSPTS